MSEEFKIEKNVPLPSPGGRGLRRYPWREMEIGDSVFIPANGKNLTAALSQLGASLAGAAPFRFVRRRDVVNNGIRVWRIA